MLLKAWGDAAGHPALVTNMVAEVTGSPARTYFDWALENAGYFRP